MLAAQICMPKKKSDSFHRFFPAKLLLFGEHTVNKGSAGLAIPTNLFEGFFKTTDQLVGKTAASNQSLELLANYIIFHPKLSKHIDTNRLLSDIENGLYFDSTIPQGYGLGSSGALAAGILHNYGTDINRSNFSATKEILADIESYFHGKSSGLDALVSFLNTPVYITKDKTTQATVPDFSKMPLKFFLLNTGKPRNTATYVNLFLKKIEHPAFNKQVETCLVPNVNLCIDSFMKNDSATLFKSFGILSQHQINLLPEFIPENLHTLWHEGLKNKHFYLKICGAGGGGFMLGVCLPDIAPELIFKSHQIMLL